MSKQYQPQAPFNVPFKMLKATPVKVNGVNSLEYVESDEVYFCSAKAYVGVAKNINDISAEEDTLTIDSYYIPTLEKNDRIKLLDDNSVWEVYVRPENINRQGLYMRFKAVAING